MKARKYNAGVWPRPAWQLASVAANAASAAQPRRAGAPMGGVSFFQDDDDDDDGSTAVILGVVLDRADRRRGDFGQRRAILPNQPADGRRAATRRR